MLQFFAKRWLNLSTSNTDKIAKLSQGRSESYKTSLIDFFYYTRITILKSIPSKVIPELLWKYKNRSKWYCSEFWSHSHYRSIFDSLHARTAFDDVQIHCLWNSQSALCARPYNIFLNEENVLLDFFIALWPFGSGWVFSAFSKKLKIVFYELLFYKKPCNIE